MKYILTVIQEIRTKKDNVLSLEYLALTLRGCSQSLSHQHSIRPRSMIVIAAILFKRGNQNV